jgi:hypothetical protein
LNHIYINIEDGQMINAEACNGGGIFFAKKITGVPLITATTLLGLTPQQEEIKTRS